MTDQQTADMTAVFAFLARAVEQDLTLNGRRARDVWGAQARLLSLSETDAEQLLLLMLSLDKG